MMPDIHIQVFAFLHVGLGVWACWKGR